VHRATEIDFSSRAVFMAAQNEASILASSSPIAARKPDRFFTVIKFWMDATSGVALELKTGVPSYQVEDGLPRRLAGGGRKAEFIY